MREKDWDRESELERVQKRVWTGESAARERDGGKVERGTQKWVGV